MYWFIFCYCFLFGYLFNFFLNDDLFNGLFEDIFQLFFRVAAVFSYGSSGDKLAFFFPAPEGVLRNSKVFGRLGDCEPLL